MPTALIGGAISGVSSIIGGVMGSNAANKAAQQQAAAGRQAAGLAQQAGAQAQAAQQGQIAQEGTNAQPFVSLGQQTAGSLGNALAPGGSLTQGYAQQYGQFQAPTAAQAEATPGYQFQLQQGMNALQNSAAARGGLLSTGTAKNLNNYAQGTAASNYQNTYNNALQAYNENFGVYNTTQQNLYNNLMGATGLGANSAAALNSVQQQGTGNLTSNMLASAQMQGNDIMGVGNALAAGTVGSSNALAGGIGGALSGFGSAGMSLAKLLGSQNAGNTNYTGQTNYGGGGT